MVPLEVDSSSNSVPSIADGQNDEHNTVRLWGEGVGHSFSSWWFEANPTFRCSSIKTLIPCLKEWKTKKNLSYGWETLRIISWGIQIPFLSSLLTTGQKMHETTEYHAAYPVLYVVSLFLAAKSPISDAINLDWLAKPVYNSPT